MMSLFSSLQRLTSNNRCQTEDFHTEIVAQVLRNQPDLTVAWLKAAGVTNLTPDEIVIQTQEEIAPLLGHFDVGSRPDISIRLRQDQSHELVYMESKIGSSEGWKQLDRYADHLASKTSFHKRTLIYITRDYEPKLDPKRANVDFKSLRWFEVYRFFKNAKTQGDLLKELLLFMEENFMSQGNQFTALDIVTLTNFQKARKLMDATLWEDVRTKFLDVCGGVSSAKKAIAQLREHNRYVMYVFHGHSDDMGILLGYYFEAESTNGFPRVGVTIEVNPKASERDAIIRELSNLSRKECSIWKGHDLANEKAWSSIRAGAPLNQFLADEDHVAAISRYFISILNDLREFRNATPGLPWKVQKDNSEDGEETET